MNDVKEQLWALYKENVEFGRHHEAQRTQMTSLVLAISAAIGGFLTFDDNLTPKDLPLSVFLIILGVFGAVFSMKYYERSSLHFNRARIYHKKLSDLFDENLVSALKEQADKEHEKFFPRLINFKIHNSWIVIHLLISILGVVLSTLAILGIK